MQFLRIWAALRVLFVMIASTETKGRETANLFEISMPRMFSSNKDFCVPAYKIANTKNDNHWSPYVYLRVQAKKKKRKK